MVLDLLVIGTAITLGPLHNTAFILVLSAPGGVRKGLAFILAWLASLALVIAAVLLLTGGEPPAPDTASSTAALAVRLALGVGMVVYGGRKRLRAVLPRSTPAWLTRLDRATGWTAAGLGVLLQPWAMVAAGGATVVEADLSSTASYLALIGYCLLATASLLAMEVLAAWRPADAADRLGRLRGWIDAHQDQAIVWLCLTLGLWLVGKSLLELLD
ncbi:GAP family protein [Kitasatospora sp. NPDC057015]|uniref:GAP family protein n=1 Tax=Kitasatospora sp. NPDC057015 TaxID=3346001 RepID=UPI00362BD266